jgi:hypothetical protein
MDEATVLDTTKILSGSLAEFLLLGQALVDANLVGTSLLETDFKDLQFAGDTKFESLAIKCLYFNEIINKNTLCKVLYITMAEHTQIIP